MLDIKILRDLPEVVRQNLVDRNASIFEDIPPTMECWDVITVDRLVELDRCCLDLIKRLDAVRRERNELDLQVRRTSKEERGPKIEEGKRLRILERDLSEASAKAQKARDDAWGRVPNLTHLSVPRSIEGHLEKRRWGVPRTLDFVPRDHLDIAESLDLVDFAAGAKVAGQKFYYLKNAAVLLDLALQHYALSVVTRHGFMLHTTPDVARESVVWGLGFHPRGPSSQIYSIQDTDLCLIGTSEITLGGLFADRILAEDSLPRLVAGISHCFRTEAGSAGQESRGLYRVHQFTKVEMFVVTAPNESEMYHDRLLAIEEEIFQGLGIPYRVLDISSGDLGGPASRKYDIEAWLPGRGQFGEVTSTSNCTDYQARRLGVKYRSAGGRPHFAHTLNGTAIATSRAMVAIIENGQQKDGSVLVPEVLQRWVGLERIEKKPSS